MTDPDRILVAALTGTVGHHARWRELTAAEEAAAAAELREFAGGRADLLASSLARPVKPATTRPGASVAA